MESSEALAGGAGELKMKGVFRKTGAFIFFGYFVGKDRADRPVRIPDIEGSKYLLLMRQCGCGSLQQFPVEHGFQPMILFFLLVEAGGWGSGLLPEDRGEV